VTYYFLDTSALVKRYIMEHGSAWIRIITASSADNTIIIAPITQVEVFSGISRRKREKAISERTARAIRLMLNRHIKREYTTIELTASLTQLAQDLLDKYPLRAYDSIQCAAAIISNNRLVMAGLDPLVFVSADTRLLTVATSEGLNIDDPNKHS
jgi:uncharacterized protein